MTQSIRRRMFLMTLGTSGAAGGLLARAQASVDEKGPQAVALGYVADAKRVDMQKYPQFSAGQNCNRCVLFQGQPTDKAGGCPLFAGQQVSGAGWCSGWTRKA